VKGITHKVIIFNEAGANAPLNTGAPFDNIRGVDGHWPNSELKQLEILRAKRIFPHSFSTMRTLRA
jgi:hypothetical protein